MKHKLSALLALVLSCAVNSQTSTARAQGTAFSYQGRLNTASGPANGTYEFSFTLFSVSNGVGQVGSPLTNTATAVSNGLFTVELDFGSQFPGAARWLEIGVRSNGVAAFATLAPRQPLTPTPYAIYAESANATNLVGTVPAGNLSGVALLNGGNTFSGNQTFNGGNIGIGTASPSTQLANTANNIYGSDGFGLSSQALGWYSPLGGYVAGFYNSWNNNAGDGVVVSIVNSSARVLDLLSGGKSVMVVNGNGNVGIGTNTPAATLEVNGNAKIDGTVTATSFSGNGSGLTAINAANVSGAALLAGGNAFTGNQTINSGNLGIGTTSPAKQLDLTGTASGVAAGSSIDPSIFMRVNNTASDGNTSVPDFAGIGFGQNSTRQAIVGGTYGNDFLDFYTGGALTAPKMRIDINGTVGITTNDVLEMGYGVAGKEVSAGKIGYERFTPDSLDIVGAGTSVPSRKIMFFAEGGATFSGNVLANNFIGTNVNGTSSFSGRVGIGTSTPQLPLEVNSINYAVPAAQFAVANCGGPCGQTNWQEAVRLWNQNGNGQVGLGFLVGAGSFSSNAVPGVWVGTAYGAGGHANDFQIATVTNYPGTNLVNRFYVNGTSGNVGIGTTTPSTSLQVNGTVTATSFAGSGSGLTNVALLNAANTFTAQQIFKVTAFDDGCVVTDGANSLGSYIGAGQCSFGTFTSHALGFFVNNGFDSMDLNTNGFLGIGTATPAAGLDVEISGSVSAGNWSYFTKAQINTNVYLGSPSLAIYTSGNIGASTYYAFSDARIKNVIGVSSNTKDLATLRNIQITDYTYKDKVGHGDGAVKKVIAQQVESVYPQAVSKTIGAIPDIYQQASIKDGWVQLDTDLKAGESVKLISETSQGIYKVLEVRKGEFRTDFNAQTEKVFVFGRQVDDFRNVDYEALTTLNISATQELAKRLEQVEVREAHLAELEQQAGEVASMKQQLTEMQQLVAQLVRESKTTKLAASSATPSNARRPLVTASLDH